MNAFELLKDAFISELEKVASGGAAIGAMAAIAKNQAVRGAMRKRNFDDVIAGHLEAGERASAVQEGTKQLGRLGKHLAGRMGLVSDMQSSIDRGARFAEGTKQLGRLGKHLAGRMGLHPPAAAPSVPSAPKSEILAHIEKLKDLIGDHPMEAAAGGGAAALGVAGLAALRKRMKAKAAAKKVQ